MAVDEQYAAILGRPRCELIGLTVSDITHADDLALNRWLLDVGRGFDLRKRYLRGDGGVQWVENRVTALALGDGRRMYVVASRPIEESARPDEAEPRRPNYGAYLHDMTGQFAQIAEEAKLPMSAELLRLAASVIAEEANLQPCKG